MFARLITCLTVLLSLRPCAGRLGSKSQSVSSAARSSGRASRAWPPPGLIYSDQNKPPIWLQARDGQEPVVPLHEPAPVPAGALVPNDPYILNSAYYDEIAPQLPPPQPGQSLNAWPPMEPYGLGYPVGVPEQLPMRPLTLLDAKGGEYKMAEKKTSSTGAAAGSGRAAAGAPSKQGP